MRGFFIKNMDFKIYKPEQIYSNKELLKDFLYFYAQQRNETNLNASCLSCITDYYNKIYKKMTKSNCNYTLKAKYVGIFCNDVYLTNENLTDKLALELLKNKKAEPETFFDVFPKEEPKPKTTKTKK